MLSFSQKDLDVTRPKLAAPALVPLQAFGCQIPICNFVSMPMYVQHRPFIWPAATYFISHPPPQIPEDQSKDRFEPCHQYEVMKGRLAKKAICSTTIPGLPLSLPVKAN